MNLQEIFDEVATHLLTQNAKSVRHLPGLLIECAYRGLNGMKCAIGCLIPDEQYHPGLENKTPITKEVHAALGFAYSPTYSVLGNRLLTLQKIHDKHEPSEWLAELEAFAQTHGLSSAALDPFRPKEKETTQ